MRGGRRPGGGSNSTRDLSPNPTTSKMKDHHTDVRRNPFPPRLRRSLSPSMRRIPRRSPGLRSASVERREYACRRSDHGKQPLSRSRPAPFQDETYEFSDKYMLSEHPANLIPELNRSSKPSRPFQEVDFHHRGSGAPPSSFSGHSGQGMLLQKSMYSDDASARSFYSLPLDTGYLPNTAPLKSEIMASDFNNLNVRIRDSEMLQYRDCLRDSYDEREREKIYPRDASFSHIPPSQVMTFDGTSSSGLAKDDLLDLYRDRLHHPSDGFGRTGGVSKLSDDTLDRNGYGQEQISDPMRRGPPSRDGPRDYMYYEHRRSERADQGFLSADDVYKNIPWDDRSDFRDEHNSSFMDLAGDRLDREDVSHNNLRESRFWEHYHSVRGDAAMDYDDMKMVHEDYAGGSGSGRAAFRVKSSRDDELTHFEERYALTRDAAPVAYRQRPRSPLLSDSHVDMYRHGVNPLPLRGLSHMDDVDIYDSSAERMVRRKYVMDDDASQIDSRGVFSNDRSAFRRIPSPSGCDEMWTNEDRVEFLPSNRVGSGNPQHRILASRMSRSDAWIPSGESSRHAEGDRDMNLKRRLRPGPSEFHGSFPLERRHDFFRPPHKFWKRGSVDRHGGMNAYHRDAFDEDAPLTKTDPPEDSEEFRQQVHKVFLRFSKLLNESPHQQKRYWEQGKAGSLLCFVCGSLSKEFVDTHSLVTHTYNSRKVGLRAEHLGLHKALCLLMGWNWLVAPDNGRLYQSRSAAEAKALKEDLILWPPIVIIHNSSVGNKNNTDGAKVVTIEGMGEILREMGFGAGKTRVCRGKAVNQSVFLVKFMPTFSGLQEAERFHKVYADKNRGRQEFQQITSDQSSDVKAGAAPSEKVEELLYGYIAIAEDLDKLDPETKKRCLVKSKKDIEAIADAPLNTD